MSRSDYELRDGVIHGPERPPELAVWIEVETEAKIGTVDESGTLLVIDAVSTGGHHMAKVQRKIEGWNNFRWHDGEWYPLVFSDGFPAYMVNSHGRKGAK